MPGAGINLDLSVVAEHEAPRDVQAETCALADRLRREERIEDALANLGWQSRSIVHDPHDNGITLTDRRDVDVTLRRVQRVVDQIRPHLIELAAESLDARKIGLHFEPHAH